MFYLYLYRNQINGMIYIGQTKNLKMRDARHRNDSKMKIDKAIKKFGRNNFSLHIVLVTRTIKEIYYAEIDWIARARVALGKDMIYNVTGGGPTGWAGMKHSKESRDKMSKSHTGLHTENRNVMFGKAHKQTSIDLISKNRKGKALGENHWKTILTQEVVDMIKQDSRSERALAKLYGVSRSTINSIKRGINWK